MGSSDEYPCVYVTFVGNVPSLCSAQCDAGRVLLSLHRRKFSALKIVMHVVAPSIAGYVGLLSLPKSIKRGTGPQFARRTVTPLYNLHVI